MARPCVDVHPGLQAVLDASREGILVIDRRGVIVALNNRVAELFRTDAVLLRGKSVETLVPRHLRAGHVAARVAYTEAPTARPMSARKGLTGERADGTEFPVEISLTPVLGSAEGLTMAVVHDIGARIDLEASLARTEHVTGALDAVPEAILATDRTGAIAFLNLAAEQLTGLSGQAAHGRPLSEVLHLAEEAGHLVAGVITRCLRDGSSAGSVEAILYGTNGRADRTLDISVSPMHNPSEQITGATVVARDVTQARLIARELSHQATHDALTGLANRPEFERRLSRAVTTAAEERTEHTLCFLDLDGFKRINDSCGHLAGDDFLRQLGDLLRSRTRSRDTLARLGGDEFGLLLEHCKPPRALRIAKEIRRAVGAHRFVHRGETYVVGVSIGIAPVAPGGGSPTEVMRRADTACYLAKRGGGNRVQVFHPGPRVTEGLPEQDRAQERWRTLEENGFRLYAQRIVALTQRGPRGPEFELLLRLDEGGADPSLPAGFLREARRRGLMPAVDAWVIGEAVRWLSEWLRSHPAAECPAVAINLDGETVKDAAVVGLVSRKLADSGVPPRALCFEVGESVAASHPAACGRVLRELRAAGCQTTLEHSGTGLVTFDSLRALDLDYLKIAGHIVRDLATDPIHHILASALIQVARAMGLRTIGFGVETAEALAGLRRLEVDYAQGRGISTPEPLEAAVATLA